MDNLRLYLLHHGVNEICDCEIVKIVPQKRGFTLYSAKNERFSADKVIVAAGSLAAPNVGGSDKGYHLLESLGHTLIAQAKPLVQLKCDSPVLKALSGQKFEGEATLIIDGAPVRKETGEILFTDYGLSGLPILQLSTHAVRALNCGQKAAVSLDLGAGVFLRRIFPLFRKTSSLARRYRFGGFLYRFLSQAHRSAINQSCDKHASKPPLILFKQKRAGAFELFGEKLAFPHNRLHGFQKRPSRFRRNRAQRVFF